MPLTECFPYLSRFLDCLGSVPPPVWRGPCTAFSWMLGAPIPVGPVAGGDVQRFAEAVDSAGLAVAAVWTACSERRAAR